MTPFARKQFLRLAASCPRPVRHKPDPEAPEKLILAIDDYADLRAANAVYHYATGRSWRRRFYAWWSKMVSGPNAGTGP